MQNYCHYTTQLTTCVDQWSPSPCLYQSLPIKCDFFIINTYSLHGKPSLLALLNDLCTAYVFITQFALQAEK